MRLVLSAASELIQPVAAPEKVPVTRALFWAAFRAASLPLIVMATLGATVVHASADLASGSTGEGAGAAGGGTAGVGNTAARRAHLGSATGFSATGFSTASRDAAAGSAIAGLASGSSAGPGSAIGSSAIGSSAIGIDSAAVGADAPSGYAGPTPVPPPPAAAPVPPVPKAVMGPTTDPEPGAAPDLPLPRHGRLAGIDWPKAPPLVPPALEDAINIVTRTYPTSLAARAALRAAAVDLRAARLERLPTLSGDLAWRANLSGKQVQRVNDTSPDPEVQVDLPIWSGGRIEADISRSHANRDSSSASYLDTVNSLALTTAQTYFDIVRLTEREQFLTGSLEEHRRLVGTIDRRVQQEVSPLADLELAKSRTAQVEQDLNTARAQRLTSLRIMAQLVADPTYDVGPIPWFDAGIAIPDSEALENEAATYSPMLRRLEADTDAARADVSSHRAAILPQVDAEYTYDDYYGHRVGGVLRVSNDATQPAQLSAAHIRVDAAEQNRRSSEVELRREVAADLIEFDAARSRAVIAKAASESAARVSESYMRQFIAGRRSWLDVMNELREAVDAQISQSEAEVSVMYTGSRLMIESGRWRPKFDAPAAP